jgi:hypothetical protein
LLQGARVVVASRRNARNLLGRATAVCGGKVQRQSGTALPVALVSAFLTASLTMAPEPFFINDTYVTYTRKCVVFPAQDLEPRVIDMTIRTVTQKDTCEACCYSRTVDLLDTYGSEHRKTRTYTRPPPTGPDRYMVHYNMSPRLPLNRCVARVLDIDPDTNNVGSKPFWRGDVVAMKFELQSERSSYIDCHDADSSAIGVLEEMLRDAYYEGLLEQELIFG